LTATVINEGLLPALDIVEKEWRASQKRWDGDPKNQEGSGALIIVGRKDQDKFFSNGDFSRRFPSFIYIHVEC
jgi:hypothetical protein